MAKITIMIDGDNVTINQSASPTKVENTTKRYFIVTGHYENSWVELVTEDYSKAINKILELERHWKVRGLNFKLLMQENDTIIPCNGTDWDIDK